VKRKWGKGSGQHYIWGLGREKGTRNSSFKSFRENMERLTAEQDNQTETIRAGDHGKRRGWDPHEILFCAALGWCRGKGIKRVGKGGGMESSPQNLISEKGSRETLSTI